MTSPDGDATGRVDPDGVRIQRFTRVRLDTWLVVIAGALVLWLALRPAAPPEPPAASSPAAPAGERTDARAEEEPAPEPPHPAVVDPAALPDHATERRREIRARRLARRMLPRSIGPDGKPETHAADAIAALRAAGINDGIAAFNPPGTDPPRAGVIVPDGIELPEGYLRHHQTTDEGEALPPILLFHPDYEFVDESGQPVEIPADRVVPPELVPDGIPIEMLEPPAPRTRAR